jgi:hypothetical protein
VFTGTGGFLIPTGEVYPQRMLVLIAPDNLRRGTKIFHKDLDCRQLRKRPAIGVKQEPVEVELTELVHPRPCRNCYPDAPVAVSVHRVCPICNTDAGVRACAHNGGVPVYRERVYANPGLNHDPGETHMVQTYVWPEHVHHYVS